jgi:hypothetical protein
LIESVDLHGPNTYLLGKLQRPSQGVHQE